MPVCTRLECLDAISCSLSDKYYCATGTTLGAKALIGLCFALYKGKYVGTSHLVKFSDQGIIKSFVIAGWGEVNRHFHLKCLTRLIDMQNPMIPFLPILKCIKGKSEDWRN